MDYAQREASATVSGYRTCVLQTSYRSHDSKPVQGQHMRTCSALFRGGASFSTASSAAICKCRANRVRRSVLKSCYQKCVELRHWACTVLVCAVRSCSPPKQQGIQGIQHCRYAHHARGCLCTRGCSCKGCRPAWFKSGTA
eukprot:1158689-Pelagomonas_calceolata.AAC.5